MTIDLERLAQEWDGEGLPPVGCKCEVRHCGLQTWVKARVVGHDYDIAVCHVPDAHGYLGYGGDYIRPIRSQAEREREEIISAADAVLARAMEDDQPMAAALYDAGLLLMPGEDVAKNARGES
jgi:hypothetical protein